MAKHLGKTEYTHVYKCLTGKNKVVYNFHICRRTRSKDMSIGSRNYDNIRDCAIAVDLWLINNGEEPVNILKKKIS